jgi:hypothetical protein
MLQAATDSNSLLSPPLPDQDKIQLKLRRSQKSSMLGKVVFVLDARADLTPEAKALVAKYGLASLAIYDSQSRRNKMEAATGHFDEAQAASYTNVGRSLWKNAQGLASAAMMALTLRVTVSSLMAGQHIECKDLDELLGAEAAIVSACGNLRAYLETAATFDGREEVIGF